MIRSKWILVAASVMIVSCTTLPKNEPVVIALKGQVGSSSETRYYSNARILTFEEAQLLRDRTESVEFKVRTNVTAFDETKKEIGFESETIAKDGMVPLHDLAFPELSEKLDYLIRQNGEVLRVSELSSNSLFYVPSIPIPEAAVKVGDKWPMKHSWKSTRDGLPLELKVEATLKKLVYCEGKRLCADLEMAGNVSIQVAPINEETRFSNRIWGRMLFSIERGDVIWSEMRSEEEIGNDKSRVKVRTCMRSETKLSTNYLTEIECDPGLKADIKVPVL